MIETAIEARTVREQLVSLVGTPCGDPRFQPGDCWGFVRYAYSLIGVELPLNIWRNRLLCRKVYGPRQFMDVVYFRDFLTEHRHVGVALDAIYFIQSGQSTNGVAIIRFNRPSIEESVIGTYRLR